MSTTEQGDALTPTQADYLKAIARTGSLQYGQGGYKSTRTIRALQAKGLVMVNPHRPQPGGWSAGLTENGKSALKGVLT